MKKVFLLGSGFLNLNSYGKPMVDHAFARERAIATYKAGIVKIYYNITVSVLNLFHVL
jgi:hypothetical protein